MRKLLLVCALLVSVVSSYGQAPPAPEQIGEDLLRIGRSQTTAGWIFGLSGFGLLAAGAATHENEFEQWLRDKEADNTMSNTLVGLGGAAIVGSVLFFISGARNKNKGRYLEMTSHLNQIPQPDASGSKVQPGICLKVTF